MADAMVNLGPDGSKEDPDDHETGTDVDEVMENSTELRMESESPSSELEKLTSCSTSDNESIESGRRGSYDVNPEIVQDCADNGSVKVSANSDSSKNNKHDLIEPVEKKFKSERRLTDSALLKKSSNEGSSGRLNESFNESRPGSAASSGKSGTPGRDKGVDSKTLYMLWSGRTDPIRREKDRERDEKRKQAQRKLDEERERKREEMREQERLRDENREKQLEARRKKIDELKQRDEERRKQVEERRRIQEDSDRVKREANLSKVKDRLTRYEQWKTHGRKGFPGLSPPSKKLSMSMSVLYHKRSPDFSSTGTLHAPGTTSLKSGAESMMALHSIPENRLGRSFVASAPPTKHKSTVNLASVKMRDPLKMSPRKPRPSSVATSMPSFVRVEMDSPKSSRSKSTDRSPRDQSKGRVSVRTEDDKLDGKDKKAATLPRPYDRKKIEERRQEVKKKTEERKEREKEKERMVKSEIQPETKGMDKPPPRMSRSFVERMSASRHPTLDKKEPVRELTPVKAKTSVKDKPPRVPKDSPAKTAVKVTDKVKDDSSETRSDTPKSLSPSLSSTPPARVTPTIQVNEVTETPAGKAGVATERSESSVTDKPPREPVVRIVEPEVPKSPPKSNPEPRQTTPEPKAKAEKMTPKTDKEREMEEYKAKLAERRRLARERAEREAEIERLRMEEQQRQEEERERVEEERQLREEEEALRLAAVARQIEEERLQRAIEAEQKRRHDEAERHEQERIAREDADRKAREEAMRREKEMQERTRKEEEERSERKKRLEMIMKRVKTDSPSTTPEKSRTDSPPRIVMSSSRTSLVSSEDEKADDTDKDEKSEKSEGLKIEADEGSKFRSPLLQKYVGQDGESGTPKFKSPLLQSIMGKTKLGARLSGTRLDEMDKSTESLSKSSEDLSEKEKTQDSEKEKDIVESGYSNGLTGSVMCESNENLIEYDNLTLRSDIDSHDSVGSKTVIEVKDKEIVNGEEGVEHEVCDSYTAIDTVTDSQTLIDSNADSALSLSFNGIGVSSHNGDIHIEEMELIDPKDLVDSSISIRTVDSLESPQTGVVSFGTSFIESQSLPSSDSTQFEEIIDLTTSVSTKPLKLGDGFVNHSEELLNLNNLDRVDNGHVSEDGDTGSHPGKPILAFEENATRRQDVTDLLS